MGSVGWPVNTKWLTSKSVATVEKYLFPSFSKLAADEERKYCSEQFFLLKPLGGSFSFLKLPKVANEGVRLIKTFGKS